MNLRSPWTARAAAALWIAVAGLSAAAAQDSGPEALPNLLVNPGVETGGGKLPAGWKGGSVEGPDTGGPLAWNADSSFCAWDGRVAHGGKRSLRVGPVPVGQKGVSTGWRSDKIPLEPGRLTFYSAWTKSDVNSRWGSLIRLDLYDKDGKYLCKFDPYIRDAHDWRELSSAGASPPGTAYGIMTCYLYYDLGVTVWFDDIAVRQSPEGVTLHPPEGATVLEPTPILAWPGKPGKAVQIAKDFAAGEIVTIDTAPNTPRSLHVSRPLSEGQWLWRVVHEENVQGKPATSLGETHRFIVKRPPYARYAFDFGGDGTPVEPNFAAVTPTTAYTDAAGCGWVDPKDLTAHSQPDNEYRIADEGMSGGYAGGNRSRTLLTPLLRDLVQGAGEATFRVKLPNGMYDVHLVAGHPSADHRPAYADFEVRLQGEPAAAFPIQYPGVLFVHRRCTAAVKDGILEIAFRSDRLDKAWFINGILIYPRAARRQAQWEVDRLVRSYAWIPDDIRWTYMPYPTLGLAHEPRSAPTPTAAESKSGVVLFTRPMYSDVHRQSVPRPQERLAKLASFATPGEVVDLTFSLFPLRDQDDLSVSLSGLKGRGGQIPGAAGQVRKVVVNAFRYSPRAQGDYFSLAPDRVEAFETVDLDRGSTQQFWLSVAVPAEAGAGRYAGIVRLTSAGKTLREIPLEIEVLPFRLVTHHLALEVYFAGSAGRLPSGASAAARAEAKHLRERYLQDLDAHLQGCNFGLEGVVLRRAADGTVTVDASDPKRTLGAYRDAGVRITWVRVNLQGILGQLAAILAPEEARKFDKHIKAPLHLPDSYYDQLAEIVRQVDQVAREGGAERVMYMIWDECGGKDLPLVIGAAKAIRKVAKEPFVYCNVPKDVYYGFGETPPEMALAPWCNVWWCYGTLSDAEREREQKRGTLLLGSFAYGPPANSRSSSGFLMWRRNQTGANMWAYDAWYASASSQLDGPYWGDGCQVYPTLPITPRLTWEATRQGIYDLRYLLTLDDLLAQARKAGKDKAAAAARQWRDNLWKSLDPTESLAWKDSGEYQRHRRQAADHILGLMRTGVGGGGP